MSNADFISIPLKLQHEKNIAKLFDKLINRKVDRLKHLIIVLLTHLFLDLQITILLLNFPYKV